MKKSQARILAKEQGFGTYVPENPCARGHFLRSTANGTCVECRRAAENKRVANNRAEYNARKTRERAHKKEQLALKARFIRASETPEERQLRLEKAKINQRLWRLKNPQHPGARAAKQRYKKENPGKTQALTIKRRAAKMRRTPAWLTEDDLWMIEQAYELAAERTRLFGFSWHVDHILPMQGKKVSGLHVPNNLQVIPWRDNVVKANKYESA